MTTVNTQNIFSCPICFETPTGEIFQCANGHPVCALCSTQLVECPQCRIKYGKERIRNRALEEILDGLKFDCPNKSFGCGVTLVRGELSTHAENCSFRGMDIPFCHFMGYRCPYPTNWRNVVGTVQHFREKHGAVNMKSNCGKLTLVDFSAVQLHMSSSCTPHIFQHEGFCFLVFARINGPQQTVSFVCIHLGDPLNKSKDFTVKFGVHSKNTPNLEWTTQSVGLGQADEFLTAPLLQIPGSVLKSRFSTNGSLQISVAIIPTKMETKGVQLLRRNPDVSHAFNELSMQPNLSERVRSAQCATENSTLHTTVNVVCDGCQIKTSCGSWYHCLQCKDYNLCGVCWKKKEHAYHFFTAIRNELELVALAKLKLDYVTKDKKPMLTKDIIIEGPMECTSCKCVNITKNAKYACMTCSKLYVLCTFCYESKRRDACKNHNFITLKASM